LGVTNQSKYFIHFFTQVLGRVQLKIRGRLTLQKKISGKSEIFDFVDAPSSERLGLSRQNVEEGSDVYDAKG
ncbi:hypothetical protein, partial [Streptococcus suis]|uniref:hypothetical protein n=2 Tax=Streptococcus suis TaxID=1307 RepID=UPI0005D21779